MKKYTSEALADLLGHSVDSLCNLVGRRNTICVVSCDVLYEYTYSEIIDIIMESNGMVSYEDALAFELEEEEQDWEDLV